MAITELALRTLPPEAFLSLESNGIKKYKTQLDATLHANNAEEVSAPSAAIPPRHQDITYPTPPDGAGAAPPAGYKFYCLHCGQRISTTTDQAGTNGNAPHVTTR